MITAEPVPDVDGGGTGSVAGNDGSRTLVPADSSGAVVRAGGPPLRRRRGGRKPWTAELVPRAWLGFVALLLVAAACAQRPGRIVADTKVALTLDPGRFLGAALHLWNPLSDSGSVGNQAAGYLMPMGPFYLLTDALGIPPAVAQRLWLAILLVAGFWGTVRLADALGLGSRVGRVLGGLGYALSPFVLARAGDNSALLLGGVFLPWALLPLVRATFRPAGSVRPALPERRAAALSGVAVLFMGGVNAVVTLEALVAPVLWLALMCRGRRAWLLRAYWLLAVVCATAWWIAALRLQSRYGIDFLQYTESANTTTTVTSLPETLRGTADWLAYFRLDGVLLPAAWSYLSLTVAVVASYVLVGLGLGGLSRRGVPAKRFLLACLAAGVLGVAAAYAGPAHGVLADDWRRALTGPLDALRNTNKFQPLVRLPLALGLACCVPLVGAAAGAHLRRLRRALNGLVALAVLAAVALGAAPLGLSRLYPAGSFPAVPAYWQQAADWLAANATSSRTLLAPASGTGKYSWGNPNDEPLLWLARTEWAVRNVIPLGGVNSTRLLDAIETEYARRSAPGLSDTLARAGVGFVLVRNDLPRTSNDQPPSTDQVRTALVSGGLERVASFGPLVTPRLTSGQLFLKERAPGGDVPAIEIFAAAGARKVDSYPADRLTVVSGGPEALPALQAAGLLGNRPVVLAADASAGGDAVLPGGLRADAWMDTDTLQRRDEQYGVLHGGGSYLLAAGQPVPGRGTAPQTRLDIDPTGHQTVAAYTGISGVTASAYGTVLGPDPQAGPPAAVDGDPDTSWSVAGFRSNGRGQWLQIDLPSARSLPYLYVRLLAESPKRPRITRLRITTDTGSVVVPMADTQLAQRIPVPAGATASVRLTIDGVRGRSSVYYGPGIRDVALPGVTPRREVVLPDDARALTADAGVVGYLFVRDRIDPRATLDFDVERQLARTFTVRTGADFFVSATAVTRSATLPAGSVTGGAGSARTVDLPCGSGPAIRIDDAVYRTYVHGDAEAFAAGQPIPLGLCTDRPVTLAAGTHTLRTSAEPGSDPAIRVATVAISNQIAAPTPATAAARTASIAAWGDERREVRMSAGPASILTVHENFNASWHATLDGRRLSPLRVDGWQQGFVVPAGAAGTVVLTNAPGEAFRWQLAIAAGLVALLLIASAWPGRRPRANPAPGPRRHGVWFDRAAALVLAAGVTLLVAGVTATVYVVPLAAAVWLLGRYAFLLPLAGVGIALREALEHPMSYAITHQGAFSLIAQTATALALAAVVLTAGNRPPARAMTTDPAGPSALGAEEEVVDVARRHDHVGEQPAAADGLRE